MRTVGMTLMLATFLVVAFIGVAFADFVIYSGNVTKLDKDSGAITIDLANGGSKSFTVTDKDVLASGVWKKRLQVGNGVDIKADGDKVITVLQRVLPVTIRPPEAAPKK